MDWIFSAVFLFLFYYLEFETSITLNTAEGGNKDNAC